VDDVTGLLKAWCAGDCSALNRLVQILYKDLYVIAKKRMQRERYDHTLQPTALLNEAYLRLVDIRRTQWRDRAHFFAISSEMMRRILVDHARSRHYLKRGGNSVRIQLDESVAVEAFPDTELLDLDAALKALEQFDPRKAKVAQLRFFAGLDVEQMATVLGVSPETVQRDWRISKAWLAHRIGGR
jgi:RNA polymerase sigma factor (TIGR02999 family)